MNTINLAKFEEWKRSKRKVEFVQWVDKNKVKPASGRGFVAIERPVSKVTAKKDKVAVKYARSHGVKFALAPEVGYASAGHVNRFAGNQVETTRQF